jgi:hypothetical protein
MMHLANPLALFLALLIVHALCDYPLQGDFLSQAKNHRRPIPGVPWYQALTAHSLIQAGGVWVVTGSVKLAVFELVCHWCIDRTKCDGTTSFDTDQMLHALCKAAWVWIVAAGLA